MRIKLWLLGLLTALSVTVSGVAAAPNNDNFVAHLRGSSEVPAVDTRAQGQTILHLRDGSQLDFKLIVANIENVTQAHIHCGAEGVNGPIVAFLYGLGPTVTLNGILSQGSVTPADIIPRPDSAECPGGVADFDDLIEKIRSGEAYVNVHTTQNPGGEVRGQIR